MLVTVVNPDNVVETILSANSIEDVRPYYPEEFLVLEHSGIEDIGYVYDGVNFIPPSLSSIDNSKHITQLAFISRFTDTEAVAIDLASQGATEPAAMLRRMLKLIESATFVDLEDPRLQQGVMALEHVYQVIAPGRAYEIINSPVLDSEIFIP
jgi:hypothetical protein